MRLRTSQTGDRIEHGHGVVGRHRRDGGSRLARTPQRPNSPGPWPRRTPTAVLYRLAIGLLLAATTSCDPPLSEEQQKEREEALQLPPVQSVAAKAFPTTRPDSGAAGAVDGLVKPGHWTAASISLRSNHEDLRGEIQTQAVIGTARQGGPDGGAFSPERTFGNSPSTRSTRPARVQSSADNNSAPVRRPAVLPQGQRRRLDTRLLVPTGRGGVPDTIQLGGTFSSRSVASVHPLQPSVWPAMPAQAYFFVVLTERPERFARLQTADWIRPRWDERLTASRRSDENYRLVLPPTDGVLPIAETALDWTSTAVLFWDDLPAHALTPMQRTAIADWVHFGGTLILNGPDAADALSDDALADLTLIRSDGLRELDPKSTGRWLDSLAVDSDRSTPAVKALLADGTARVALAGEAQPTAQPIGEGDAVWVGRLGRGRVVQTRFDLLSDWLTSWKSYDSFFNGAVLGRPPRLVEKTSDLDLPGDTTVAAVRQRFVGERADQTPPQVNTGLRWFSRDARLPAVGTEVTSSIESSGSAEPAESRHAASPLNPWADPYFAPDPASGMGGWNENSPWLTLFQQTLKQEIGITIPDSSLVIRSLAIYLVLLVPINYLVFRLLGRLEWAWWAVIPIAIGGAFLVARAAQLDVGLVRSRNELAMLELQPNHPRGHLTRLVSVYNSLANSYSVQFESPDACVTTVDERSANDRRGEMFGDQTAELTLGYDSGPALQGVRVGSNSYVTIHAEQILGVAGTIRLQRVDDASPGRDQPDSAGDLSADALAEGDWILVKGTNLDIADAVLIVRPLSGPEQVAVVGGLGANETAPLRLRTGSPAAIPTGLPMGTSNLMQRLVTTSGVPPGSIRLVGRLETPLPGMSLRPEVQQTRAQTLLLAHLAHPPLSKSQVDENLIQDFDRSADPSHVGD